MNPDPKLDTRRGSALILAVGATIPLLVAGGVLLTAITRQRSADEQSLVVTQARDASSSGAQQALARLTADPNYTGSFDVALRGPSAEVTVTAWADDGVDNDENGAIDEAAEADFLSVTSVGTANVRVDGNGVLDLPTRKGRSTTVAILRKTRLDLVAEQAVYIDDPLAAFKFSGTAFLISGEDTNIDGTPGPNDAIAGIGTPGDPEDIKDQLKANQEPLVVGIGGPPSVHAVADVEMIDQIEMLQDLATVVWDSGVTSYNGDIGDRSALVPVIAHAKGDLKLNGDTKGCGILIVDGDLTINGSFDFVGFIFTAGGVTFNGGGGAKNLHGALFTLGAVDGTDVTINGGVQLRYSSEALTIVTTQLAGSVSLVSWTQR